MRYTSRILGVCAAVLAVMASLACSAPQLKERRGAQPNVIAVNSGPGAEVASSLGDAPKTSETPKEGLSIGESGRCPHGMALIEGRYCIDRYEASLVELKENGEEKAFSPFTLVEGKTNLRAVSQPNVFPQGYISAVQAQQACLASGKRLCKIAEWQQACAGPEKKHFGYADQRQPGRCNDTGKNPVRTLYGFNYSRFTMNQPSLNQVEGTLAKTGSHDGCTNGYGVFDMVGNLHEWVSDPNGTFFGGYYQDVMSQGHGGGCGYLTTAHNARYHDYSTGFRCCADLPHGPNEPEEPKNKMPAKTPRPRSKRR
jgi:formylglycine-generating enzyme